MKTTTDNTDLKNNLLASFEQQAQNQATYIIQKQAIENFERLGLPTTKHEEWKYTNLASTLKNSFAVAATSDVEAVPNLPFDLEANVLVFINGVFSSAASQVIAPETDLVILPMQEAFAQYPDLVTTHFARHADSEKEAFTALNTAFASNALFVHVPKNKVLAQPVVFYYLVDATQENVLVQPRSLVVLGENSQSKWIEIGLTAGENHVLSNGVTEIVASERALVEWYQMQLEGRVSINTTAVSIATGANFSALTVTANGQITRNNLQLLLNGPHCEGHMYGLYLGKGKSLIDNHTVADHRFPNCESNELYKGVLSDRATGVFNGKIFVKPDAQKTNAFQSNRNILLSDDANAYTKPQLEIFADDVKCSHGATVGTLDEEPLFYLRARGLSEDTARALLLHAFAADVLEKISIPELKEYADQQLEKWLNG
ncbi:Fe-S cluster assembly protein SufD [Flexibacter flexilis DSM 6793]|uniref:Fe-S cluster assembly protein SufD n=1 Tax=Flexibacter flexilis DSM 6793 TaxID=927664 RepID=A0A1I1KQR5_9BACT|nr:Fe-S cluster assembly protein SufD [Flexibacter flexilis]SFC60513.1 Fe-S cluster assembly protein SufD [Flexibacter flexilis DSM 6793]